MQSVRLRNSPLIPSFWQIVFVIRHNSKTITLQSVWWTTLRFILEEKDCVVVRLKDKKLKDIIIIAHHQLILSTLVTTIWIMNIDYLLIDLSIDSFSFIYLYI